jgi:hypothetical protein
MQLAAAVISTAPLAHPALLLFASNLSPTERKRDALFSPIRSGLFT